MMRKLIALIVIVVIIIIAAVALTHKSNTSGNTYSSNTTTQNKNNTNSTNTSNQVPTTGAISIKNMAFTPSQISVSKGGTVTWTNNDTTAHTVTDDLSNVDGPASGTIEPGQSYSFTFNKTGSFQYHCSIHPSMRGTIVVK